MPKPEEYNSSQDLLKLKREARRIDEEGKSIQSSTTNIHVMQGGDDQMPGQNGNKVRFAPNSASSFEYPKSFNNDSSADITMYDAFNENPTPGDKTPEGHGSSLDI